MTAETMNEERKKLYGFYSDYKNVTEDQQRLIDDLPCDFVMLSRWNVEDDGADTPVTKDADQRYDEAEEEIYYGFGKCVHQLFPMETTELIPVKNARDIFVRGNIQKGTASMVAFSCFRYED